MIFRQCAIVAAISVFYAGAGASLPQERPNEQALTFWAYRAVCTTPTYSYEKVHAMIKNMKEGDNDSRLLAAPKFRAMPFKEKFTYTMLNYENSTQNCDGPMITNKDRERIYTHLPDAYGDAGRWSKQQEAFLHENRTKVIGLLRQSIKPTSRVGLNFKNAIQELDAWELTPDLIAKYRRDQRDVDILATLVIVMRDLKFRPFITSSVFKASFGKDDSIKSFIPATATNRSRILKWASDFYRAKHGR